MWKIVIPPSLSLLLHRREERGREKAQCVCLIHSMAYVMCFIEEEKSSVDFCRFLFARWLLLVFFIFVHIFSLELIVFFSSWKTIRFGRQWAMPSWCSGSPPTSKTCRSSKTISPLTALVCMRAVAFYLIAACGLFFLFVCFFLFVFFCMFLLAWFMLLVLVSDFSVESVRVA